MSTAIKAVSHILQRMQKDGRLASLLGSGSESFDLLTQAHAEENGLDLNQFRKEFGDSLTYEPWPGEEW